MWHLESRQWTDPGPAPLEASLSVLWGLSFTKRPPECVLSICRDIRQGWGWADIGQWQPHQIRASWKHAWRYPGSKLQTPSLIPSFPHSFNDDLSILCTYSAPCIVLGTGNITASKTPAHREFAVVERQTVNWLIYAKGCWVLWEMWTIQREFQGWEGTYTFMLDQEALWHVAI